LSTKASQKLAHSIVRDMFTTATRPFPCEAASGIVAGPVSFPRLAGCASPARWWRLRCPCPVMSTRAAPSLPLESCRFHLGPLLMFVHPPVEGLTMAGAGVNRPRGFRRLHLPAVAAPNGAYPRTDRRPALVTERDLGISQA